MKKEYRVWNDGSPQGHYIIADSPKRAFIKFAKGPARVYYPVHVILWKKGKDLGSLRMTEQATKFRDYISSANKYTKYGRKYYKKDL